MTCPSCGDSRHRIVGGGDEWVDECGNELCVHYPFREKLEKARFASDTREDFFADSRFYEFGEVAPW